MTARLLGGPTPAPGLVALLLHGGGSRGEQPPGALTYARMLPFAHDLRRRGIAARLIRYRRRGWNGRQQDPVHDVRWALDQLGSDRVVLIGHSMGGRAALWCGGDPRVVAVCGLAPWIEPGDPWGQLAGKPVLLVHGARDRVTDPRRTQALAQRLGARFVSVQDGHTMLRRPWVWSRLVGEFTASAP